MPRQERAPNSGASFGTLDLTPKLLFSIAKSHNLTVDELLELNEIGSDHMLHPGERLRITAPRTVTAGGM